jgi:pyruvate,water dikinase
MRAALAPDERIEAILGRGVDDAPASELARIAAKVRAHPLDPAVAQSLRDAARDLRRAGARGIAVRSSSSREDEEAASAAGLHATFLDLRSDDAVLDAVRACWASLYEPRVVAYLRALAARPTAPDGASALHGEAQVGVVLQAMVPADVSGVMFTVNPLTADPTEIVVDASYGLGALVVDGRVTPDTYRLDKATGHVRDQVIGTKQVRKAVREEGVVEEEVGPAERAAEALAPHQLEELCVLARRIEAHFGAPRDVEWAYARGTLYVLQARPVTAVSLRTAPRRGRTRDVGERARIVWSNVNVGEALPGVATPLTWSVLSRFSDLGFRRAFGSIGCSVPRDAELVGSFRGRIYLNLSEFMAICSQVPGLRPRTLLALAGGGEIDRLEREVERRGHAGFFARLPLTVTRFARENARIGVRVEEFEAEFEAEHGRIAGIDLRILSSPALSHTLRDVERLLDATGAIMLTCYGNLLSSAVLLHRALALVAGDRAEALARELTTGLSDLESAAPGLGLWHIAEMARAEERAAAALREGDPRTLRVEALPQGPTRRALERFLDAYGGRGAREAEIAEPRWREDPSLLFAALRAHLTRPEGVPAGPAEIERRRRAAREAAEAELERLVPILARPAVRHVLALEQRFVRLRERLRARVTEVLGLYRRVALEAGRRIDAREACGADAAFFLTIDELHAWLGEQHGPAAPLVRARRIQYERDRALPDPPDTFVGHPPPPRVGQVADGSPDAASDLAEGGVLRGLAASGGRARGRARVLTSVQQAASLVPGEVLVAPYADIGWSPLFLVASAVVADLGGPLSHAAIVAREYGVPTVMNTKHAMRSLRTGDLVEVDGDLGTVTLLSRAGDGAP